MPSMSLARLEHRFYRPECNPTESGQSGPGAAESRDEIGEGSRPTPKHVATVHEWLVYRHEVTRTPFRTLAAEIGIPKSTVQKFYKEKFRPSKVWPKLRDWYMRDRQNRHAEYRTPPEDMVMSAVRIVDEIPAAMRGANLRDLAEFCREMFEKSNVPCPEWVGMLAALAEEQSNADDSREKHALKH